MTRPGQSYRDMHGWKRSWSVLPPCSNLMFRGSKFQLSGWRDRRRCQNEKGSAPAFPFCREKCTPSHFLPENSTSTFVWDHVTHPFFRLLIRKGSKENGERDWTFGNWQPPPLKLGGTICDWWHVKDLNCDLTGFNLENPGFHADSEAPKNLLSSNENTDR